MKPIHIFTCGASEYQVTAKDERQAKTRLAEMIKDEGLSSTVKDWKYKGCYDPN
jgi:hypothetical protein